MILRKFALYKESNPNHDRAKDMFGQKGDGRKAVIFHQNLLNYIKEWANVHTFIDGKVSEFRNLLELLDKHKVTFPPPEARSSGSNPRATSNSNTSALCANAQQLVLSVGQIMDSWMTDKELIATFKEQMKETQKKIQDQISNSLEEDSYNLLDLNDYFNQLPKLMDDASKGDKNAQQSIITIVNNIEKSVKDNKEEAKNPLRKEVAVPKKIQREVKKEIKKEVKKEVKKLASSSYDEFEVIERNKIITPPKEFDDHYVKVQPPYETSPNPKIEEQKEKPYETVFIQPVSNNKSSEFRLRSVKKPNNPFKSPVKATQQVTKMTNEFFTNIQPKQNDFSGQSPFAENFDFPSDDVFQFEGDNPSRKNPSENTSELSSSKSNPNPFYDSNLSTNKRNNYLYPDNNSDKMTPEKTTLEKKANDKLSSDRKVDAKKEKDLLKEQEEKRIKALNAEKGNELKRQIEEFTKENDRMRRKNDRALKANEELKEKYDNLIKLIIERRTESRSEISKVKSELAKLDRDIVNLETSNKEIKNIEIENEKIALENSQLEDKIKNMKPELEKLKKQNERLITNKDTMMNNIENLKRTLIEEEAKKKLEEEAKKKFEEEAKKRVEAEMIEYSKPQPVVEPVYKQEVKVSYEVPSVPINDLPTADPFAGIQSVEIASYNTSAPEVSINAPTLYSHVLDEMSVPDADPNAQQVAQPGNIVGSSAFYTAVPAAAQPMIDPIEHAKNQMEGRYREALAAPKGILYEDHILQLGIIKNVNKTTKTVNIKLFFGNKMTDTSLTITKCSLGIHDSKSLSITFKNTPKTINPKGQTLCEMTIQVGKFFSVYNYFTIQYDTENGVRNLITLKVPVNILMLCEASSETLESIQGILAGIGNSKVSGSFELDTNRLKSMSQVRKVLSEGNTMCIIDKNPGTIFAVTQFPNTAGKVIQAIAHINISKNVKQCGLVVYGSNPSFRDTITKNILDVLSAPKQ